jgi:putative PIN family toxin of toxin-antitoxin system
MIRVVIDTNVLVSALWMRSGNPHKILDGVGRGEYMPCYDFRILAEYDDVLRRPKFMFPTRDVNGLIGRIKSKGFCTVAPHIDRIFVDDTDRAFYEVAVNCDAYLITGNRKHYPNEPFILTPSDFLSRKEQLT